MRRGRTAFTFAEHLTWASISNGMSLKPRMRAGLRSTTPFADRSWCMGRRAAAQAARDVGGHILEVGVGTGLSFDDYDSSTTVTGIDLCRSRCCRRRGRNSPPAAIRSSSRCCRWTRTRWRSLTRPFDCVVAQFVITLVANPEQVLSECHRVVKPGGRIILVNHLYSERGVAAAVERWAAKKTRKAGLAAGIPVRAAAGVGCGQRRGGAGRAAQDQAVRHLHPGQF